MAIVNGTQGLDEMEGNTLPEQSFLKQRLLNGGDNFTLAGTDRYLGSGRNLSVFQPKVPNGYYFLGQVAVQGYPDTCPSSCQIVQPMNDDPKNPCLKAPTGFSRVWWEPLGVGGITLSGCQRVPTRITLLLASYTSLTLPALPALPALTPLSTLPPLPTPINILVWRWCAPISLLL
jgi:hypothetical protein